MKWWFVGHLQFGEYFQKNHLHIQIVSGFAKLPCERHSFKWGVQSWVDDDLPTSRWISWDMLGIPGGQSQTTHFPQHQSFKECFTWDFQPGYLGDEKNQWRKPRKPHDTLGRFLPVVQQLDSLTLFRGILFRKMDRFQRVTTPWKFNIATKNLAILKGNSLPIIIFKGLWQTLGVYCLKMDSTKMLGKFKQKTLCLIVYFAPKIHQSTIQLQRREWMHWETYTSTCIKGTSSSKPS